MDLMSSSESPTTPPTPFQTPTNSPKKKFVLEDISNPKPLIINTDSPSITLQTPPAIKRDLLKSPYVKFALKSIRRRTKSLQKNKPLKLRKSNLSKVERFKAFCLSTFCCFVQKRRPGPKRSMTYDSLDVPKRVKYVWNKQAAFLWLVLVLGFLCIVSFVFSIVIAVLFLSSKNKGTNLGTDEDEERSRGLINTNNRTDCVCDVKLTLDNGSLYFGNFFKFDGIDDDLGFFYWNLDAPCNSYPYGTSFVFKGDYFVSKEEEIRVGLHNDVFRKKMKLISQESYDDFGKMKVVGDVDDVKRTLKKNLTSWKDCNELSFVESDGNSNECLECDVGNWLIHENKDDGKFISISLDGNCISGGERMIIMVPNDYTKSSLNETCPREITQKDSDVECLMFNFEKNSLFQNVWNFLYKFCSLTFRHENSVPLQVILKKKLNV